jgi:hypothetical protein
VKFLDLKDQDFRLRLRLSKKTEALGLKTPGGVKTRHRLVPLPD